MPHSVGDPGKVDSAWRSLPVMLLAFAGVFSQGLAPLIVHGLADYAGLTTSQAGLCVAAEMAGSTFGIAAVLFLLGKTSRHRVASLALGAVIAGNMLCIVAGSAAAYMGARFVAGVGCGLTTSAFGIMATTGRPARNFAIFSGASVVLMSAADACIPALLDRTGLSGLFALIAAPAVLALPFAWLIPTHAAISSNVSIAIPVGPSRRAAVVGLLTNALFFTALAAFWTYVTEIAVANGNDAQSVAHILAATFLLGGIGGSALAALISSRLRPTTLIGINTPLMAAAVAIIVWVPGVNSLAAAVAVYLLLWFLTYPFLMALLAGLDAGGGLTVVGVLTQSLGWLAGPALGSLFVAQGSHQWLGALCCVGFLLAAMCSYISRMQQSSAAGPIAMEPGAR
jgi:MFS transporter, DHA1 family, inner membrane transport protein